MPVKSDWVNGDQFNASDANDVANAVNAAYVKPVGGVPLEDLESDVQLSLGRADTAVQSVDSDSISDASTTGKQVLTAADAAAARSAIGVSYGSSAGTVVEGDDARLSPSASSISDSTTVGRSLLTAVDAATARSAIGVAYGSAAGTVAQGNDSRITGAEQAANRGVANGYASLDANAKVPGAQLPNSIMTYEGLHDVSANSPEISDATGSAGQVYRVSVGGTRDYGSGDIELGVGDYLIHSGTEFQKADTTDAVSTVAGRTGNVVLTTADVDGAVSLTGSETLTGKTLTSPTVNGGTLNDITVNGVTEGVGAVGTVGATATLSIADATILTATLTASTATTFTMPSAVAGKSFLLILKQPAVTGGGTATFTGVLWAGGEAPTVTADAGAIDVFSFVSDGSSWFGSASQAFA